MNLHRENASYIHIEKTAPSPGGHFFPLIIAIFILIRDIDKTNVLTKFHDIKTIFELNHLAKNVSSRLFTCFHYIHIERTAPPAGGHVFSLITTIFKLNQDIHKTNILTKFPDDKAKNVTSREKDPPGGHFFLPIRTIFKLNRRIQETNVLTKFDKDWAKNVSSRLFTCFHYIHIEKTAPPPGGHVFPLITTIFKLAKKVTSRFFLPIRTIFELNCRIQETNVLTKFHEDWAKNVSSRLFTCFHYIHIEKTAPPSGGHVFPPSMTIFELVRDIYKINVKNVTSRENYPPPPPPGCHVFLTTRIIFELNHWTKNVTSRVFTCFHYIHIEKTAPPPGDHVFSPIWTIFELIRDINKTNVLTKFHDDWAKIVTSRVFTRNTAPLPGGNVFQWTGTIFKLNQHIIKTNILTKLHEDWASNVFFTVFTSFKLGRGIIGTNPLTKFHEDLMINVASRVFTRQNVDDERRTTDKGDHKSSP
ncbi:hypothetical protein DPMN_133145 [Dreissena polymorpha]|uniref:Uncharacterized protein n=1 Tax=Dreissena polymorpha TaxID=45954 RepID=A0A9D4FXB9_DREPO|nr:hypothetical protein DPMN_133145 [Dreissena polymorpha]